ncbi:aromatic ring-hydroxylating dioxygenase subunit alpha [Temperatibacter marinus]|uniref:Aromatic ring-hydroxylating dioxygenase subunit alpha n=1 Tax=Temperatibacter marinus TaxID=1456591 RepID=A0AA52EHZ0_9PROT|nr:aromatic ring-hydroxylating dioxygenase subunit alpha [Temperatibacter marinus]WND03513.1 aromatic ring-hydroxylating dioxygenase subunit alpha [Temperatibacter marinus]
MLINMWYVAEEEANIKEDPVKVKILGQDLVVFRDGEGRVVCLSDICPHKGASLSGGVVRDGHVACPYHGWQFGHTGACLKIPAAGEDAKIPNRARVDSYPVEIRYGWVWVFLGDLPEEERPPIPEFPEYEFIGSDWGMVRGTWEWNANYERVLENGLDFGHAPYVHPAFGDPDEGEINHIDLEPHEWGARARHLYKPPRPKGLWASLRNKKAAASKGVEASPGYHVSGSMLRLEVNITASWKMIIFDVNIPVDENTTKTYFIAIRNFFKSAMWDFDARKRTYSIFEQDQVVVEKIRPEMVPEKLAEEMSVQCDVLMMDARKKFKALKKKGWEIDLETYYKEFKGKRACVIPSPARRENPKGWIIPTIPLLEASE